MTPRSRWSLLALAVVVALAVGVAVGRATAPTAKTTAHGATPAAPAPAFTPTPSSLVPGAQKLAIGQPETFDDGIGTNHEKGSVTVLAVDTTTAPGAIAVKVSDKIDEGAVSFNPARMRLQGPDGTVYDFSSFDYGTYGQQFPPARFPQLRAISLTAGQQQTGWVLFTAPVQHGTVQNVGGAANSILGEWAF